MPASPLPPGLSSVATVGTLVVPVALVTDSRLNANAVRCWCWIASRPQAGDDDPPTRREIGEALGVSPRGATRLLVLLESTGWVRREPRWAQPWGLTVNRTPVDR